MGRLIDDRKKKKCEEVWVSEQTIPPRCVMRKNDSRFCVQCKVGGGVEVRYQKGEGEEEVICRIDKWPADVSVVVFDQILPKLGYPSMEGFHTS